MSKPPYDPKKITPSLYGDRSPVEGKVVAILHVSFKDRGLKLIDTKSRAVPKHEIHEIMITDEKAAAPGGGADRVAAVAFFEITKGGLIVTGDVVTAAGKKIGDLVGYDENHMPNHLGIILWAPTLDEPALAVGDRIVFHRPG
ncbi:MAG: hypothetical protein NTV61_11155 [Candidatus Bathyarchaeota archaeon]|nr:hypothetical protein [Candidatus Bathyarchaeota archaeon]